MRPIEELMFCTHCRAPLGNNWKGESSKHEPNCIHFGQVVPSECKGLIDAVIIEILDKRAKEERKTTPEADYTR